MYLNVERSVDLLKKSVKPNGRVKNERLKTGLDKFGYVFKRAPWQDNPGSFHLHPACYISISSSEKLVLAQQRNIKEHQLKSLSESFSPDTDTVNNATDKVLPPKRLRLSISAPRS